MTLKIKIWNVLQGLAIYINTPNNKHIVIDAGINEDGFEPITHINNNHDVDQIDYAIITHPHKDHIQEIKNLVKLSPIAITRPKHIVRDDIDWSKIKNEDKEIFETYFDLSEKYNSPVNSDQSPTNPNNNGGVI